jgi:hypothetical protein
VSIPTFSSYQPPGVYVQSTNTPIVTPTGVPPQTLTLIGPAAGYRTAVQSFLIYTSSAFALSFTGVFQSAVTGPPAIAAPVVTITATGQVLTVGTDYSLTTIPDPSGNSALAVTTVAMVSSSPNVTNGTQVTITYNYADITYYQPQVFTNYQSVANAYGPAFVTTTPASPGATQISNPLSFAAQLAFTNGANTLITIALNPSNGTLEEQYEAAYSLVQANYGATILVPVWSDDLSFPGGSSTTAFAQQLAADLNAACVTAAADGYPRIGFFGLPRLYSESVEPVSSFAATVDSERLVLVYPEIIQVYNGSTGQVFTASGCYMAVALGAILSSLPIDTGLTSQTVSGFSLTAAEIQNMTNAFMNSLASSGVCIVYQNYVGALQVRHGLTTNMSALNYREISMVRQNDALLMATQQGMAASGLIGTPITSTTVATVQAALIGILQQQLNNSVIQGFQNVTAAEEQYPGGDPTVIACSFQYLPAVPLNYITVTFSINLTSGQVTTQSAQNASASSLT